MTGSTRAGGVFTTDLALVVRSWDEWLTEVTGVAEADACGRALGELFPDLAARGVLARLERVAASGSVEVLAPAFHHYLIPCSPRQPSSRFTRMQQHATIAPLLAGEQVVGVTVTLEDVTARLEREGELAEQLKSPDDSVRIAAARAIAAEGAGAAPLAEALGDESWQVRRAAAEGLARGDEASTEALVAALRERHRDPAVLNATLAALTRSGADVTPQLVALLAAPDTDAELRTYTALALGLLEDRRAVPALVRALDDGDANVRFHAIEALGRIRSREAAGPLAAIAESRDFSVAFAALDALGLIGEPSVASRIVPLLDDELLQPAAAEALGRLGSEEAVGPLAALLAEPGPPTIAGATALATLHARLEADYGEGELVADLARAVLPVRAADNLTEAMRAADEPTLASLAAVLGWMQGPGIDETLAALLSRHRLRRPIAEVLARRGTAALPALVGALAEGDGETRKAAAAALGRIGSPAAVGPLVALLDDDPDAGVVVAGALGSIGDPGAFEPLLAHLGHPQAAFRQSVVAALNSIGHPEMGRRVVALLADPSPAVRESAAKIAGYFGYAEALEPLLALADDPVEEVRRVAVEQLAHLEDARALAAMTDALERGTPGVRAAAARALAHVPAPDALPRLLDACDDEDPWVRYYAARSAGRQASADALSRLTALASGDPVPPVRMAAIDALGEVGGARAAAALLSLARDRDESIARQALEALGAVDAAEAVTVLAAATGSPDRERALIALRALARHRDAAAVAAVERVARTGADAELRDFAVETLGTIGGAEAIAALVRLAADPRRGTSVVAALARQDEAQVESIGRELRAADDGVRCILVEALGRMKHRGASLLLAEALHDPAVSVRFAAVQALGRRDLRDVETGLVAASREDEDATVRRAAQRALAR